MIQILNLRDRDARGACRPWERQLQTCAVAPFSLQETPLHRLVSGVSAQSVVSCLTRLEPVNDALYRSWKMHIGPHGQQPSTMQKRRSGGQSRSSSTSSARASRSRESCCCLLPKPSGVRVTRWRVAAAFPRSVTTLGRHNPRRMSAPMDTMMIPNGIPGPSGSGLSRIGLPQFMLEWSLNPSGLCRSQRSSVFV